MDTASATFRQQLICSCIAQPAPKDPKEKMCPVYRWLMLIPLFMWKNSHFQSNHLVC